MKPDANERALAQAVKLARTAAWLMAVLLITHAVIVGFKACSRECPPCRAEVEKRG